MLSFFLWFSPIIKMFHYIIIFYCKITTLHCSVVNFFPNITILSHNTVALNNLDLFSLNSDPNTLLSRGNRFQFVKPLEMFYLLSTL